MLLYCHFNLSALNIDFFIITNHDVPDKRLHMHVWGGTHYQLNTYDVCTNIFRHILKEKKRKKLSCFQTERENIKNVYVVFGYKTVESR